MERGANADRLIIPAERPSVVWSVGSVTFLGSYLLNSRVSDFSTLATALGLYSAALLGVFGVLANWRSAVAQRRPRELHVGDKWAAVVDRSVDLALKGSRLAFLLMVVGVVVPAIKLPVALLVPDWYPTMARVGSSMILAGVAVLAARSWQIINNVKSFYIWNNQAEARDAKAERQRAEAARS